MQYDHDYDRFLFLGLIFAFMMLMATVGYFFTLKLDKRANDKRKAKRRLRKR